MVESLLIAFREGIEAFLIVAIAAGYLSQTGRKHLLTPLFVGVIAAVGLSYLLGGILESYTDTPQFEGWMAIIAAVLVASLTVYVSMNAKKFKKNLENRMDLAGSQKGFWKYLGVFLFSLIMVSREGFEVAVLMSVIAYESEPVQMYIGATLGVIFAFALGFVWIKYSHLINIGKLLKITSVFLILFTIHLVIYGLHELSEVSALPFINNDWFHIVTEEFAEGIYGDVFSYLIVIFPFTYLAYNFIIAKKNNVGDGQAIAA